MRTIRLDAGFRLDDPNSYWGNPSFQLEPGDPGYVPPSPTYPKHKKNPHMAHQPYLPKDDEGIKTLLMTFSMGLTDALATKYAITPEQRWRLKRGWLAFEHLLNLSSIYGEYSKALTTLRESMFLDGDGAAAMLAPPTLPAVPTLEPVGGGAAVPVQVEADFFDFLGRLVAQIKQADVYDPSDGNTLGIIGAEIPPPPVDIKPMPRARIGPNGKPIITCKKSPFQGYQTEYSRNGGPYVKDVFSSSRECEMDAALPPAGTVEVWRIRVQYRLNNAPFGQPSDPIEIDVRGR